MGKRKPQFFLDGGGDPALRLTAVCKFCNRQRGQHQARTLRCPVGLRTRIGYIDFHQTQVFSPKKVKP